MDLGAPSVRVSDHLKLAGLNSLGVGLMIDLAIAVDFHFKKSGKRIDHRYAYSMKSAGNLVGIIIEFSAGMKLGHDNFHRRHPFSFMNTDRNAATVVHHTDAVVLVNNDLDGVADSGHGFIDAVVHNLVDQVMKPFEVHVSDIHGGSFSNSLKPLEYLYAVFRIVRRIIHHIRIGMMALR